MCADLARLPSLLHLLFKLKGLIGEHSCPQMTQMNADKSATGSNGISRDLVQAPSSCATHEVSLCLSLHLRPYASSADDFFGPLLRIRTTFDSGSTDGSPKHLSHILSADDADESR